MSIELDEGTLGLHGSGPSLHYAAAMPTEPPRAMLSMIHGYADHGARYAHVMGALAEHGIGSVIVDLRGHGRTSGRRGHCEAFSEFLDDARDLRKMTEQRGKGAPHFVYGHSFGGLVATHSVLSDPQSIRGLVLSSPFFGLGFEPPRWKVLAGRVASKVMPTLSLPSGLEGKDMTHDMAKVRDYDNDPLSFKKATARWFTETQAAQARALSSAPRLRVPLFVTFGMSDHVANPGAGKKFFDAAGSEDKTWVPRPGLLHELHNEPSWKETTEAIAEWVLARV